MEILTEFQKEFLKSFANSPLKSFFFFGGGTALAHYYLKHRYSDDLDFFTTEEKRINFISDELKKIALKIKGELEIKRFSSTFVECVLRRKEETVFIHFALESPFRFKPLNFDTELGMNYENLLDLSCNKFSALFERHETKDFVDVYFISREFMDFWELYDYARKKHIGMEEYWLALSLDFVYSIQALPRMIKPITIEELQEFYEDKIMKLMERIKRGEV